jgi:hypothetical protein
MATGGGVSIFGFHFGAGGSATTHRNITEVRFIENNYFGQIVIPPSPPGLTFLLGALLCVRCFDGTYEHQN